ncbi:MAG: DUF547 domain-containing protein [Desulfobacula sp.]|jgi:hypothetical protein|nr:DUF547 domain-containing protein [Desulfobacula sp.]
MKLLSIIFTAIILFNTHALAESFDHKHTILNDLLKKHVSWNQAKTASTVNYKGISIDRKALRTYLDSVSAVTKPEFTKWSKNQQLAFLINIYNAFTIELILTKYPNLKSIKDIGSLFKSPWKKNFFTLFGKKTNIDEIEHGLIRQKGVYDDPRIHLAIVCASIGCPALRNEAYTTDKIDGQLDDNIKSFLSDRTRNRYNTYTKKLEVSKIFDWYKEDFNAGYHGIQSLPFFLGQYAKLLADNPIDQEKIKLEMVDIIYLDYDWSLNDN